MHELRWAGCEAGERALEVWRTSETARFEVPPEKLDDEDWLRETYLGSDARLLIASVDGVDVGVSHWIHAHTSLTDETPLPDVAHISSIYVHPDAWGQGIGRAMLRELMRDQRDAGMVRTRLFTDDDNLRAQGLYLSEGFALTGLVIHNESGSVVVELEKVL